MNPLRLLALLLLGCAGCSTISSPNFSHIHVTDPQGHLVADWIARGQVRRTEYGYAFRAVERTSAPPRPVYSRYPYGRLVEATGPNIVVTPCGQPLWLYYGYRGE